MKSLNEYKGGVHFWFKKKLSLKTVKSNQTYNLFWTFLAPLDTYFKLFFNIFCFLE